MAYKAGIIILTILAIILRGSAIYIIKTGGIISKKKI
jgi:hypothetical protein